MEEQLVDFERAKLAKEKGFIGTIGLGYRPKGNYYNHQGILNGDVSKELIDKSLQSISAPTQSMLQRWLREVHQIEVKIVAEHYHDGTNWNVQAAKWNLDEKYSSSNFIEDGTYWFGDNGEYDTYEKALEKGLQEALNLI